MIDYSKWYVLDIETTVRAKEPYAFPADPACPDNKMVLIGCHYFPYAKSPVQIDDRYRDYACPNDTIFVGHNFKFDLRYIIRDGRAGTFCLPSRQLAWDTMIAEYMISGQKVKMASLDDLAEKYLGRKKQDDVKKFWDAGLDTTEIDREVLERYLRTDIELTRDVYLAQVKHLDDLGATALKEHIVRMSAASIYYAYCEHNGLPISREVLEREHQLYTAGTLGVQAALYDLVERITAMPTSYRPHYDPTTPANVAALLFGGTITAKWSEIDLTPTKAGKPGRRRRAKTFVATAHDCSPFPPQRGVNGVPCVDERTLLRIKEHPASTTNALTIAGVVLDYRARQKLLGTYFAPALNYMDKTGSLVLHPNINTAATDTGRTSASSPNSQNMPEEFEKCIKSRFENGVILKADFKQLEVCALAELSRDPQLILDLNNDVDVHFETGKSVFGWRTSSDMTTEQRKYVKRVNFLLIYGGGARGAAATLGIKQTLAQQIIDAFYARYPGVKRWHGQLVNKVKAGAQVVPGEFVNGHPQHESFLSSPMGRVFRFEQHATPEWLQQKKGIYVDFMPTQIVNYPVQGYATGDIVPAYLLECLSVTGDDIVLPVNVVHDAGWFDCEDEPCAIAMQVWMKDKLDVFQRKYPMVVPLRLDFTIVK